MEDTYIDPYLGMYVCGYDIRLMHPTRSRCERFLAKNAIIVMIQDGLRIIPDVDN